MLLLKITLQVFTICVSTVLFAQSNTVTSGENTFGTDGNVSNTIGQIDCAFSIGAEGNLNEGVQQPYEFYAVSSIHALVASFSLSIGPNPTANDLMLTVSDYVKNDLEYSLSDMNGKLIIPNTPLSLSTIINLERYTPGMYQLFISDKHNRINSYTIIKH